MSQGLNMRISSEDHKWSPVISSVFFSEKVSKKDTKQAIAPKSSFNVVASFFRFVETIFFMD